MNNPLTSHQLIPPSLDTEAIRKDFPILDTLIKGKPLAYLDNAASSQMPSNVINRISAYHLEDHSNIHRAVHTLSEKATAEYESARGIVKKFLNSRDSKEIVFTKGTTNGINLVARGYGAKFLNEGDEILISYLEHHSNIVPWQLLCEQIGAKLKVVPITDNGDVNIAKQLIKNAKDCGFDSVKFQKRTINIVYDEKTLDTPRESPWGTTTREQKLGLEFEKKEYDEIDKYCKELNIDWFASAWDIESLKF